MGQTRVNLLHLLEDLRDAYPGSLPATIVAETVANSLDSGAGHVAFRADPAAATLAIVDDGGGMTRAQLRRYHDLAATSKRRGRGIGFAGVGIKLALLACEEVITETRRAGRAYATVWHLSSRHKAPWRYVDAPGLVAGKSGTAVRLRLENPLSELLDERWLEATLRAHFAPLFDAAFDGVLEDAYPVGIRFFLNGRPLERREGDAAAAGHAPLVVRMPRKRKPSAVGWLARADEALPEDRRGVAVSTLGKMILRGWDWLGIAPVAADRITGLVEAPALSEALTLNKADFVRTGTRGATYLAYRKAVQQAVSDQLAAWGDGAEPPPARRPRTRPIERDLEHILIDLADDFPLLATLVDRRPGGQRRIPFGGVRETGAEWSAAAALQGRAEADRPGGGGAGPEPSAPEGEPGAAEPQAATSPGEEPAGPPAATLGELPGRGGHKRPGRYGLEIRFESRPDLPELGRLVESTVWVNDAHPAWRRLAGSRAEGYHIALTAAMALAPLAAPPGALHAFITTFLERWGEAAEEDGKLRPGRARRRGARR